MPDLKMLTHADFKACLSEPFHIEYGDAAPVKAELIEVETTGIFDPAVHKRQAFSAIFRGPMTPLLAQKAYPVKNTTLGNLKIFLVPIGPDQQGMRYEAIFA
jgi:hypothetical protein